MTLIQRLVFRKIAVQTVLVFAFVGVIVTTTQVLNQLFRMIDASSSIWVAAQIYVYFLPTITVTVLPLAFLIACINVFDQVDDDRESIVLTGAGAPPRLLLVPAGLLALIVSAAVVTLSLFIEPRSERALQTTFNELTFDALKIIAGDGTLQQVMPSLFVRGGGVTPEGNINGIFILDRRNPNEETTYVAERGVFVEEDERTLLRLENGSIQIRASGARDANKIRFGRFVADPDEMFGRTGGASYSVRQTLTSTLVQGVLNPGTTGLAPPTLVKELVRRTSEWLYPVLFFGICAFLMMRSRFSRGSMRWRLPVAVLIGFAFKAVGLTVIGGAPGSAAFIAAAYLLPVLGAIVFLIAGLRHATQARRSRRSAA
ncbi:LptF/LptG family permease [Anianabacter salinae]|uniref:LptF/LptG family permease n=1 Tax=Anianabacter salinae TaxID=2851023 RepID=UPI00225DEE3C|nr:LptF/LptG family permease [Anianabacter salinae]MBV0912354.1 LptF/LptG family permease [Anianabacter salinae]